jgi:hypothetical protein
MSRNTCSNLSADHLPDGAVSRLSAVAVARRSGDQALHLLDGIHSGRPLAARHPITTEKLFTAQPGRIFPTINELITR